ncbi:MAG: exopolysaccharide biosynthesis protein [Phycisphaerales bacterium]|nr:exopolysaccharide biosynthesis protein [Phycisphaerales bacterium]
MRIPLRRSSAQISELLRDAAGAIRGETVSIRDLLDTLGHDGLLLLCILFSLPFAFPVSIPGTSMPFGAVIVLISVGMMMNHIPWLPRRLVEKRFNGPRTRRILLRASLAFRRIQRLARPRLLILVQPVWSQRLNGAIVCFAALLMMAPIPVIGTNSPPAWAVMLVCFGMSQRDGAFVLAGYVATAATAVFFAALAVAAAFAGRGMWHWLNGE